MENPSSRPYQTITSKTQSQSKSQLLREKGNHFFKENQYLKAIKCYSKAIILSSNESTLYSNRARCYYMLKDYEKTIQDSQEAIKLDEKNIKAYLLYIKGLGIKSKYFMSISHLELGLEICRRVKEIIRTTAQNEFESTYEILKNNMKAMIFLKKREIYNNKVLNAHDYYKGIIKDKRVKELFDKYVVQKNHIGVPDSLCCPITFEMFTQPVITESGNTYDARSLSKFYTLRGQFDPISRIPINIMNVFINDSIKNAKKWYNKIEPWSIISETLTTSLDIDF
ncbi:hypothetical protein SteCoe_23025 [Stentor coeruleus]|uniref:RING-type E3 ubiquitin transferase n=1 Tax=Stentor coeruleus TaxID=5963 RepID=A0A1R2BL05_9CILI|nr:hypothetical protein SteCoe_23025 [Stentor coeruleus]